MSFDLYIMHEFARELNRTLAAEELSLGDEDRPMMMLLTVNELEEPHEITYKLRDENAEETLKSYLHAEDSVLDGVYLEWTDKLVTEDANALSDLCKKFKVGVW